MCAYMYTGINLARIFYLHSCILYKKYMKICYKTYVYACKLVISESGQVCFDRRLKCLPANLYWSVKAIQSVLSCLCKIPHR